MTLNLKIRTLNNIEIEVDSQTNMSIKNLKIKIMEKLPEMDAQHQMLIHQGKILLDAKIISDYPNIKQGDRLVVLVPKRSDKSATTKPLEMNNLNINRKATEYIDAPKIENNPSTISCAPTKHHAITQQICNDPVIPICNVSNTIPESTASAACQLNENLMKSEECTFVAGNEIEEAITSICSMGFDRTKVEQALRVAFNNPSRAVDYLMNGIPSQIDQNLPLQNESSNMTTNSIAHNANSEQMINNTTTNSDSALSALRNHELFDRIRQAIRQTPHLLPNILRMISNGNPELAELIINNQAEFLQLISEENDQNVESSNLADYTIQINREQQEQILKLQNLGFSENAAVQALIICEWDEEQAANYLFDNTREFVDEDVDNDRSKP